MAKPKSHRPRNSPDWVRVGGAYHPAQSIDGRPYTAAAKQASRKGRRRTPEPLTDREAAVAAINDCVARLRVIGKGTIPRQWKSDFLKAIQPLPKKRGRKPNPERDIQIAAEYFALGAGMNEILDKSQVFPLEPPDEEQPGAQALREIAKRHGVSQKTALRALQGVRADDRLLFAALQLVLRREIAKDAPRISAKEKKRW